MRAYESVVREATERELDGWPAGVPFAVHPQHAGDHARGDPAGGLRRQRRRAPRALRDLLRELLAETASPGLQLARAALAAPRRPGPARAAAALRQEIDALLPRRSPRARARTPGARTSCRCWCAARFEDGSAMDDDELRDQLVTLLLAGHETTATALAWTFDLLLRHPRRSRGCASSARASDATCAPSSPSRCGCARSCRSPAAGWRRARVGGLPAPAGHRRHAGDLARPHARRRYPEPYAFRPERFLDKPPVDLRVDPVRRRRPPLPRRGVRRVRDARRARRDPAPLRPARRVGRRAERVARRNVTFSPRHGTRVIAPAAQRRLTPAAPNRASGKE